MSSFTTYAVSTYPITITDLNYSVNMVYGCGV